MSGLTLYAVERWPTWFPGENAPAVDPIVLGGGPAHRRRSIVFLLPRGASRPRVVLKVAFTLEEAGFLEHEFQALSRIRAELPPHLRTSIPHPLGFDRVGSTVVFASRALRGRRLLVPNVAERGSIASVRLLRGFLRGAFAWSRELARATRRDSDADEGALEEQVDRFVSLSSPPAQVGARVRSFARAVGRARIRWNPVWQHRDVAVGNTLKHRGTYRFLDWEHASAESQPWFDVAYAPGSLTLLAHRQSGSSSVRDAALGCLPTVRWPGQVLRQEMDRTWSHPLPIQWAVALVAMSTALRRHHGGRKGWTDWGEIALCLLADDGFRRMNWLAPEW